jgi:uncharacterized protein (TIGR03435 family)
VFGQTLTFEVASVKLRQLPYQFVKSEISGSRATWEAYGLEGLIMEAYRVASYQISGVPAWLATDRFDINAKASGDRTLTADEKRKMLRALLEDRFHLKVHREVKERPVYSLVGEDPPSPFLCGRRPQDGAIVAVAYSSTRRCARTHNRWS